MRILRYDSVVETRMLIEDRERGILELSGEQILESHHELQNECKA